MKNIKIIRFVLQFIFLLAISLSFLIDSKLTTGILLLLSIVGGAFYCGWVCPFGFIQDLMGSLGKKLKINNKLAENKFKKYFKYSRYIIWGITLFFSFDILFSLLSFDPKSNLTILLKTKNISAVNLVILLLFSVFSLFNSRFFCKYLCIEGTKHSFLSIFKIFSIKRDENNCINCKRCDKACPVNIKVSENRSVSNLKCNNCFSCISQCPVKNTLSYGRLYSQNKNYNYIKSIALALLLFTNRTYFYEAIDSFSKIYYDKKQIEIVSTESSTNSQSNKDNLIKSITKEEKIESPEKTSEDITNIEPIETNLKNESDKEKVVDKPVKIDSKKEIPISNKEAQNKSTNNILKLEGTGQGFKGPIQVEVTLEDDKIIGIEILSNNDDGKWFDRAKRKTIERILENQNTEIDSVAGATFSSNGIIEAVKNALNKK